MARTFRRKTYVPTWVTRDSVVLDGNYAGYVQLEGDERKKQLRWWHEDKNSWWNITPHKSFRKAEEAIYRQKCNNQLHRFVKNHEHEVLILEREPYPYWD